MTLNFFWVVYIRTHNALQLHANPLKVSWQSLIGHQLSSVVKGLLSTLPPPSGMTCLRMFGQPDHSVYANVFYKLTCLFNRAGCWRSWLMVYVLVTSPLLLVFWFFYGHLSYCSNNLYIYNIVARCWRSWLRVHELVSSPLLYLYSVVLNMHCIFLLTRCALL